MSEITNTPDKLDQILREYKPSYCDSDEANLCRAKQALLAWREAYAKAYTEKELERLSQAQRQNRRNPKHFADTDAYKSGYEAGRRAKIKSLSSAEPKEVKDEHKNL